MDGINQNDRDDLRIKEDLKLIITQESLDLVGDHSIRIAAWLNWWGREEGFVLNMYDFTVLNPCISPNCFGYDSDHCD